MAELNGHTMRVMGAPIQAQIFSANSAPLTAIAYNEVYNAIINEGYDRPQAIAPTACSSVLGVIIPPSILMIFWGGVLQTSVGALFLAGAFLAMLIPIFLICGIVGGIVTPTESALIPAGYFLILVMFVYRTDTVKDFGHIFYDTGFYDNGFYDTGRFT